MLELIREGGPLAMLACVAGVLGTGLGAIALILVATRSSSAVSLAVITLVVAIAAAGLGMVGTALGKRGVEDALAHVGSPALEEQLRVVGHREAQRASLVGFGAGLLPLLLGAAAAVGARARSSPAGRAISSSLLGPVEATEAPGMGTLALGLAGVGGLVLVGAWMIGNAPLPVGRYPFDGGDSASWLLAGALEEIAADPAGGCGRLEIALEAYWSPSDRREWPRRFSPEPHPMLAGWRDAASACVRAELAKANTVDPSVDLEALLGSPLLVDEALRAELLSRAGERRAVPSPEPAQQEQPASAGLSTGELMAAMKASKDPVRRCYEAALRRDGPGISGKLVVQLTLSPSGKVTSAKDTSTPPFPSPTMSRCVLGVIKALTFPRFEGDPLTVSYPFVFSPAR